MTDTLDPYEQIEALRQQQISFHAEAAEDLERYRDYVASAEERINHHASIIRALEFALNNRLPREEALFEFEKATPVLKTYGDE